jgi:hypothetical protein
LRIDADGVWSRSGKTTVAWSAVELAASPRTADDEIRLLVREAGLVRVPLAATGLTAQQALDVMRRVNEALRVETFASNGFVLPIHGATDVPDIAKVGTYG